MPHQQRHSKSTMNTSIEDTTMTEAQPPPQPQATDMPRIRCLPATVANEAEAVSNLVIFKFLAEGAANAVFRVQPSLTSAEKSYVFVDVNDGVIVRDRFLGKVIRISKGKPKTLKYRDIISGYEDIMPLFKPLNAPTNEQNEQPEHAQSTLQAAPSESFEQFLMDHEGVSLAKEVLDHLIDELDAECPLHERTELHALEERAILLPDMSSIPDLALMIEIKPKWLLQSPNAPRDAYRCRTCALHASRKLKAEATWSAYVCPLQLLAGKVDAIERYVKHRIRMSGGPDEQVADNVEPIVLKRTVAYLTHGDGHKLLRHLKSLQAKLDPKGALERDRIPSLERDDFDRQLRLAMTFRDTSLFIRVPYADTNQPIEAKLGDLDFKSADKIDDWMDKELMLVNGGWYTNLKAPDSGCLIAEGWKKYVPHYM